MEVAYLGDDDVELDFEADLRAQDAWRESQLMQETGGLGSMARGIMRPGGRHTIVCRHWLRDLCMKGDKCDFLHQYDLARMPECAQWSKFGKCPDNDCDFRHDTEKMECQKYKFGFCKLGSQCRMRHDKLSRAYLPEAAPDWYLKEIIPNFFDFVPKLPEETVRVSGIDEAPPMQPTPMMQHATVAGWHVPPPQPVHGTDSNWAAAAVPSWNVRPQTQTAGAWSAQKVVVDLTDDKKPGTDRRRREYAPRAGPEGRQGTEAARPKERPREEPPPRHREECQDRREPHKPLEPATDSRGSSSRPARDRSAPTDDRRYNEPRDRRDRERYDGRREDDRYDGRRDEESRRPARREDDRSAARRPRSRDRSRDRRRSRSPPNRGRDDRSSYRR
jgi:hypothetical protein